jgi:hypothetical protein
MPLFFIVLAQISKRSAHDLHHAFLGVAITILMTTTVTVALKHLSGRYRPDWNFHLVAGTISDREGRYSFPYVKKKLIFC